MVTLQKIKAYIVTGQASSAPPLGPLLGQYQVNISDFVPKFNQLSLSKFEQGVTISVWVFRNPKDKTYRIDMKGPTVMGLLNSVTKLTKRRKREAVPLEMLYDIIVIKHRLLKEFNNRDLPLKSVAKSILSSLKNSKIKIKIPKGFKIDTTKNEKNKRKDKKR